MSIFKPVSLERAVPLFRLVRAISRMTFVLPVVVLFFQYKGVTTGDFFLVKGLFHLAIFAIEIPTGYIGDLFSRKKVIVLSFLILCIGDLVWYLFSGFWAILLGQLLLGVSISLFSGTGEAYVFDVLKKQGKENSYQKEWGRIETWSVAGTVFSTFLGGILFDSFGPDFSILLNIVVVLVAIMLSLFLTEVSEVRRVVAAGKSKWQDILDISKAAVIHPEIKWLMLFPATFGAGTLMLMWGVQPLMLKTGLPVALFGFFVGANHLFRMSFSHFAHGLFQRLRTKWFSLALFGVLCCGFVASVLLPLIGYMPLVYILLVVVAFAPASQIAVRIVSSSMINHRIKSDERATVLSVSSMFLNVFNFIALVLMKFMIDGWNLSATFAVMGGVVLLLTGYSLKRLLRLRLA